MTKQEEFLEARALRLAAEHRDVLKRLLQIDLAVIERRIAAAAGSSIADPHTRAAALLWGIPENKVTPNMRKFGKIFNHFYTYSGGRDVKEVLEDLLDRSYNVKGDMTGRTPSKPNMQDIRFANEMLTEVIGA